MQAILDTNSIWKLLEDHLGIDRFLYSDDEEKSTFKNFNDK